MVSKIKQILINELGITRQAIEHRRDIVKKKYGPMSDEVAYGVLAHLETRMKIDVSKYVKADDLTDIRDICLSLGQKNKEFVTPQKIPSNRKISTAKERIIKIGGKMVFNDPLLPRSVLTDVKKMTDIYATVYVFENSVREFIRRVLTKKYGDDWWYKIKSPQIEKLRKKIEPRLSDDERNQWHCKRGPHPIYYTDFKDLLTIIEEDWTSFESLFPDFDWVKPRISETVRSRNVIDHHNPLSPNDQSRIQVFYNDWCKQINAVRLNL